MRLEPIAVAACAVFFLSTLSACGEHPPSAAPAAPPPSSHVSTALQSTLQDIVARADGRTSVSVLELRTGARASVSSDAPRPMMSVFKLPLVVATFADIEAGKFRLDQRIPLREEELRDISPIADAWHKGEHEPTLEAMLRATLQDSDNTVGDKLVTMLGGGPAVTGRLRGLGLQGIVIGGQELRLSAALHCVGMPEPAGGWTVAAVQACPAPSAGDARAAVEQAVVNPPDHATSEALVELLARLDRGTLLAESSRRWILDTLAGTRTGPKRLAGLLPPGTRVAHKTGTGDTVQGVTVAVNDVGLVSLPSGDRYAIAVLVTGTRNEVAASEAVIARVSRAAYDAFAAQASP